MKWNKQKQLVLVLGLGKIEVIMIAKKVSLQKVPDSFVEERKYLCNSL